MLRIGWLLVALGQLSQTFLVALTDPQLSDHSRDRSLGLQLPKRVLWPLARDVYLVSFQVHGDTTAVGTHLHFYFCGTWDIRRRVQ